MEYLALSFLYLNIIKFLRMFLLWIQRTSVAFYLVLLFRSAYSGTLIKPAVLYHSRVRSRLIWVFLFHDIGRRPSKPKILSKRKKKLSPLLRCPLVTLTDPVLRPLKILLNPTLISAFQPYQHHLLLLRLGTV